jgi:hypothetical protein
MQPLVELLRARRHHQLADPVGTVVGDHGAHRAGVAPLLA